MMVHTCHDTSSSMSGTRLHKGLPSANVGGNFCKSIIGKTNHNTHLLMRGTPAPHVLGVASKGVEGVLGEGLTQAITRMVHFIGASLFLNG